VKRQRRKQERPGQREDIARLNEIMLTSRLPKFVVPEGIWIEPALPDAWETLLERNPHLSRPFKADPQTTGAFKTEPELCSAFKHVWFLDALLALQTGHRQQTDINWLRWFTVREARREGLTWEKAYREASKRLKNSPAYGAPSTVCHSYKTIQAILRNAEWG
jgi:hypothetical protein